MANGLTNIRQQTAASSKLVIEKYYHLTKPGIIRGNAITATAGYFLGYGTLLTGTAGTDLVRLLAMISGLSLVIASACVCNNYMDRIIDQKMSRTCDRALVKGTVSDRSALLYATILGCLGVAVLLAGTNALAASLAVFGFIAYVIIYGAAKRTSVHGTVIGSISGAIPPVVGYSAVTGRIDLGAILLFLILACWQMPHFYAIAIFRAKDYAAAHIPVLPVVKGLIATKRQIIMYILAFTIVSLSLFVFDYAGPLYAGVVIAGGLSWSILAIRGLKLHDKTSIITWSRQMFGWSLLVLTAMSLSIAVDALM